MSRKQQQEGAAKRPGSRGGASRGTLLLVLGAVGLCAALLLSYSLQASLPSSQQAPSREQTQQEPASPARSRSSKPRRSQLARFNDESKTEVIGNRTYYPSFGLFPKGCRWRPVREHGKQDVEYVWWDASIKDWVQQRPSACAPPGHAAPGPASWNFNRGTPRTEVSCDNSHCMYTNLYYNQGRWYALVDGGAHVPTWRFSRNQEIVTFHVEDAWDFVDSVK